MQDELDASIIYATIENEIAPLYYKRDSNGVPHEWVACIRRSMMHIALPLLPTRMQQDYLTVTIHLAARLAMLRQDSNKALYDLVAWKQHMLSNWNMVVIRVERLNAGEQQVVTGNEIMKRVLPIRGR